MQLDDLSNLTDVLKRLPDNHYRVYLILEDGTARLVRDVAVRQGRPVDPTSQSDETPERPPLTTTVLVGTNSVPVRSDVTPAEAHAERQSQTVPVIVDPASQRPEPANSPPVVAPAQRTATEPASQSSGDDAPIPETLIAGAAASAAALVTWHGYRTWQARSRARRAAEIGAAGRPNPFSRAARWARRIRGEATEATPTDDTVRTANHRD
jgi:hypothetical protein